MTLFGWKNRHWLRTDSGSRGSHMGSSATLSTTHEEVAMKSKMAVTADQLHAPCLFSEVTSQRATAAHFNLRSSYES